MITIALLAAATPSPVSPQFSCTLIGPDATTVMALDVDFTGKKKKSNTVVRMTGTGPAARVSATSAVARMGDGASAIAFATGTGRYRLELTPEGSAMRARLAQLADGEQRPTAGQGYCAPRVGKRLSVKKLKKMSADTVVAARPWRLQPIPGRLPDMRCRLVGPDRRVHDVQARVTSARANELSASYSFGTSDLIGARTAFGSGTQFYLVAPAERLVAATVQLAGSNQPFYMHTTFERLGNWADLSREKRVLAVGACGQPLPMITGSGASR